VLCADLSGTKLKEGSRHHRCLEFELDAAAARLGIGSKQWTKSNGTEISLRRPGVWKEVGECTKQIIT
jgi:hypothetical protein